jgi:hypothetical protein
MMPAHPNCQLKFKLDGAQLDGVSFEISSSDRFSEPTNLKIGSYKLSMTACCGFKCEDLTDASVAIANEESTSLYFWLDTSAQTMRVKQAEFKNKITKSSSGRPFVKIFLAAVDQVPGAQSENNTIILKRVNNPDNEKKQERIELDSLNFGDTDPVEIGKPTDYLIFLNDEELGNATFKQGGNYNMLVSGVEGTNTIKVHQVTPENTFSMFWQLPQYVIMTAGEVLFSITTMEFCFTQVSNISSA